MASPLTGASLVDSLFEVATDMREVMILAIPLFVFVVTTVCVMCPVALDFVPVVNAELEPLAATVLAAAPVGAGWPTC
jgi:hypothetical protein